MKNGIDVLLGDTQILVEDIRAFNKEYVGEMNLKKESYGKVFANIESSLTSFHNSLSNFDVPATTSVSQEWIFSMISSLESCFKTQFSPISDIVLRLITNDPRPYMNVSQGGDKGGGSLKDGGEDKGKVVGKVFPTQFQIHYQ